MSCAKKYDLELAGPTMSCPAHPAYMVPNCLVCAEGGYERQLLDDQRDVTKALDLLGI